MIDGFDSMVGGLSVEVYEARSMVTVLRDLKAGKSYKVRHTAEDSFQDIYSALKWMCDTGREIGELCSIPCLYEVYDEMMRERAEDKEQPVPGPQKHTPTSTFDADIPKGVGGQGAPPGDSRYGC